jgi:hypothetical protein
MFQYSSARHSGGQMKAVGILHQELAGAHHAETRADFVAELGLDLVVVDVAIA